MSGRQLSAARGGLAPDAGDAGYCAGGMLEVLEVLCPGDFWTVGV